MTEETKPAQTDLESDSTAEAAPAEQTEKERPSNRSKVTAKLMTRPSLMSALTSMSFVPDSMREQGGANIITMHDEYKARCEAVVEGDMTHAEALLISQAMSLNSIYNECASLAGNNIGSRLATAEVLMRMALKAQAQCTQTLRVLGELKNPKAVAFIKQQNNAAGNQQVNNAPVTQGATAHAHGEKETSVTTNELLADNKEEQHAATLDAGTKIGTSRENQTLETVGAVDRASD
ncbi:hypothetical protein PQR72_27685 [Paraburkholderia madseniana]|uniref:hypothetical protein n=1 Tax=Paraburkholderia madseniana TaxID=2599607 RepID=UPI0015C52E47|nr:hypothetical protein [Paraburkholderia madseniana]NPT68078.1 hypothetical protein [Paraburkholderia madseniana]